MRKVGKRGCKFATNLRMKPADGSFETSHEGAPFQLPEPPLRGGVLGTRTEDQLARVAEMPPLPDVRPTAHPIDHGLPCMFVALVADCQAF